MIWFSKKSFCATRTHRKTRATRSNPLLHAQQPRRHAVRPRKRATAIGMGAGRYNLKCWIRYLHQHRDSPPKKRYLLFERALKELPGSYKLWIQCVHAVGGGGVRVGALVGEFGWAWVVVRVDAWGKGW